jgi:hypothetical protein
MNAEQLLDVLRHSSPHREVYMAKYSHRWLVTYGGGEASAAAVHQLVQGGQIQSVYSNCPNDSYHIGRTWDYERTMAARKILGKAAPDYFVGDACTE